PELNAAARAEEGASVSKSSRTGARTGVVFILLDRLIWVGMDRNASWWRLNDYRWRSDGCSEAVRTTVDGEGDLHRRFGDDNTAKTCSDGDRRNHFNRRTGNDGSCQRRSSCNWQGDLHRRSGDDNAAKTRSAGDR